MALWKPYNSLHLNWQPMVYNWAENQELKPCLCECTVVCVSVLSTKAAWKDWNGNFSCTFWLDSILPNYIWCPGFSAKQWLAQNNNLALSELGVHPHAAEWGSLQAAPQHTFSAMCGAPFFSSLEDSMLCGLCWAIIIILDLILVGLNIFLHFLFCSVVKLF